MCTVGYFDATLNLTPNDAMAHITHTDDNLNKPEVMFYNTSYSNSFHNISLKRKLYLLMIRIRYSIKHNKAYLLIKRLKCWKQIEYIFMQDALKDRMGTIFSQSKGYINKDWVLLDSQSTIDLFCNASLLTNIRVVSDHLNIFCNAESASINMVGDLGRRPQGIWYSLVLCQRYS